MSLLNISSCFTREFVATGRRMTAFVDVDGFRDGILNESFGSGMDSMFLDWGPALVTRWLNWENVECGSILSWKKFLLRNRVLYYYVSTDFLFVVTTSIKVTEASQRAGDQVTSGIWLVLPTFRVATVRYLSVCNAIVEAVLSSSDLENNSVHE